MKRRNDLILFVSLIAAGIILIILTVANKTSGSKVYVNINSEETDCFTLSENVQITLMTGQNGKGSNTLEIFDGKARIINADCPDKICVHHLPICFEGETIVCLPNRLVIEIR